AGEKGSRDRGSTMVTTAELPTRLETRLDRVKPPIPQPRTTTFGSEGKAFQTRGSCYFRQHNVLQFDSADEKFSETYCHLSSVHVRTGWSPKAASGSLGRTVC